MGIETESDGKTWCVGQVSLVQTKKKGVLWSDTKALVLLFLPHPLSTAYCASGLPALIAFLLVWLALEQDRQHHPLHVYMVGRRWKDKSVVWFGIVKCNNFLLLMRF